jgi:hypothetical protein
MLQNTPDPAMGAGYGMRLLVRPDRKTTYRFALFLAFFAAFLRDLRGSRLFCAMGKET